ncbi:hypothetical protein ACNOYE_12765 [Nannocystaceae bacterium ST9]
MELVPAFVGAEICEDVADWISTDSQGVNHLRAPADCCTNPPFDSSDSCEALVESHLEASRDAALEAGLIYAADCLDEMLADPQCPNPTSGSFLACEDDCPIFHGDRPEAAECESFGHRMSDCARGLVCGADRVCHPPCELPFVAPAQGFCGPGRGMWFVTCDAGLACSDEGICQPAQPLGAPCDAATACAVGGWCDPSDTCVADLPAGSLCTDHDQCEADICKDGACFEPESFACGRWGW